MRQASLKLKMYMGNVNIVNNNIERKALHMILLSFGILAFFYVIFLGNMVFNIVERRALEHQAMVLSNEVGDLELNYLSLSKDINLNLSHSMGFKETVANFATRKSLGSLKISNNEI